MPLLIENLRAFTGRSPEKMKFIVKRRSPHGAKRVAEQAIGLAKSSRTSRYDPCQRCHTETTEETNVAIERVEYADLA